MSRTRFWMLPLAAAGLAIGSGAAPAARSYLAVEKAIDKVRADWAKPGVPAEPNADAWNLYLDAIKRDLSAYAGAPNEAERRRALDHLYKEWSTLNSFGWKTGEPVRDELAEWLRPRVILAWGTKGVVDAVSGLPETADATLKGNRDRWVKFVDNGLNSALHDYESAPTVAQKHAALVRLYGSLNALDQGNKTAAWSPSVSLQSSLNDLVNRPNLHATADVPSVYPKLAAQVVTNGPVTRKGTTAYVTAGPYEGFGLMASDDGIAFYNKQVASSVAPQVYNFQGQVASDPKGKRAAKLYYFNASTFDSGEVSVVAVIRPTTGLSLYPSQTHATGASVTSVPTEGHNLGRGFAKLLGLNQSKINQKVYEGAIGKIVASVAQESAEEAQEESAKQAAEKNVEIRKALPGDGSLTVNNFKVVDLSLKSRPEHVLVEGTVQWNGGLDQVGAELPRPATFATPATGVSADVHLSSLMTNLTRGYLASDKGKSVKNLMIVTKKVPPNTPPAEGIEVGQNVDFATFSKAIDTARAANDPQVQAIRVKNPGRSPEFSADKDGHLIALVHDFALEVPAPAQAAALGGPARILRLESPNAEFEIEFKVELAKENVPIKLLGRIVGFDAGPGAKVFTIDQDETKATELSPFTSAIVLATFGNKLKGQPIDAPLADLQIPGFELSSVSPLDPSGWIRLVLTPKS